MNYSKCGIELISDNKAPKLNQCKPCRAKYRMEYRATHRERIRDLMKNWNETHREERHVYSQAYRASHLEQERNRRLRDLWRDPYGSWKKRVIKLHKAKGFDIQLAPHELEALARDATNCRICDVPLDWINRTQTNLYSPTLDRIDNEKIVSSTTIQIVCKRCNTSKCDMTMSEFVNYCEMVTKKFANVENVEELKYALN